MGFEVRLISNEGTASPFIARMYLGIGQLRDLWLDANHTPDDRESARLRFDSAFGPVRDSLASVRANARDLAALVVEHSAAVADGSVVEVLPNGVQVHATIDEVSARMFASILESGYRAMESLQAALRVLGTDIGFTFAGLAEFQKGIVALHASGEAEFATYLESVRANWSQQFRSVRADHTHRGWRLDRFQYERIATGFELVQPKVADQILTAFATASANRLCMLAEDLVAYAVVRPADPFFVLRELSSAEQDPTCSKRFEVALAGTTGCWRIQYRETTDFTDV